MKILTEKTAYLIYLAINATPLLENIILEIILMR